MNYSDAYRQIMKSRGYTLSTASKYLGPLGYKLALVPVGSRLPDGSHVLDC